MQKAVEIERGNLVLRGVVHIPEGISGKVPLVCMFHGFKGNKEEKHFMFVKMSRLFEKKGIASLRFDFSGSGESDGEFVDMTILTELHESKTILDYAKGLDFVDIENIGVLGLSMGGAVASILAGDCNEDVKALCLWAPAGNMQEIVDGFKTNQNIGVLTKRGFFDLDGFSIGKEFVKALEKIDIFKRASNYEKNVLLIHGNCDEMVSFNTSERYLDIYGEKSFLHPVEGSDHTFNKKEWEDEVLECTVEFFKNEFKG